MGNSSAKKFDTTLICAKLFLHTRVEYRAHTLTITLNRPEKRHAIDRIMANELVYCLDLARQNNEVRVVVIRSEGAVFCAGADLMDFSNKNFAPTTGIPYIGELNDLPIKMRAACKPIIVSVQGVAMAGSLLMICNATHVIASDEAKFSAPEVKRGLWPFMVMAGLMRVMPRRPALDFMMRAYPLDATSAEQQGLVTQVVQSDELALETDNLAAELAQVAPAAIRFGLEAFYQQESLDFDEAIPYLKEMLDKTLKTEDAKEGIAAFKEKRQPVWKG
ncbi:MAG: enoyl-CoA hydratase/isomerase family protein [Pseudomonadales bacterium]|nr:enoyl-CoA hydratase/isomerase family protein [Pseudomonadales bacterium]